MCVCVLVCVHVRAPEATVNRERFIWLKFCVVFKSIVKIFISLVKQVLQYYNYGFTGMHLAYNITFKITGG